jgi:K+-transporting ATPase A subunit
MKKNMGAADRVIRTLIAVLIGVLFFKGVISGVLGVVLGILAIIFLATSLVGWCPMYLPLKLSTCKAAPAKSK